MQYMLEMGILYIRKTRTVPPKEEEVISSGKKGKRHRMNKISSCLL